MNEKIRELISQSYEATTVTTIDPFTSEVVVDFIDGTKPFFNQEKFAELLVQECADLAYSYNIYGRGRAWNLIIKEHFGIAIADTDLAPYLRSTGVDK